MRIAARRSRRSLDEGNANALAASRAWTTRRAASILGVLCKSGHCSDDGDGESEDTSVVVESDYIPGQMQHYISASFHFRHIKCALGVVAAWCLGFSCSSTRGLYISSRKVISGPPARIADVLPVHVFYSGLSATLVSGELCRDGCEEEAAKAPATGSPAAFRC